MKSSTIKRLGALLVVSAPLVHDVVPRPSWIRTSAAIAAGLMMIFFAKEAIDDERVRDLKLKAVNAAFSVSFTVTLIVNWFLNRDFDVTRDFDGRSSLLRSISAFDLIILTMVIALGLFHYWRYQDSNSATEDAEDVDRTNPRSVRSRLPIRDTHAERLHAQRAGMAPSPRSGAR